MDANLDEMMGMLDGLKVHRRDRTDHQGRRRVGAWLQNLVALRLDLKADLGHRRHPDGGLLA